MEETRVRGGVLLRFAEGADAKILAFVPASIAMRLCALGSLVPLRSAPAPVLGIALAEGAVVTVLRLGDREMDAAAAEPDEWIMPGAQRAVICRIGGVDVALTGGTVVATGVFDAAPEGEGISWRGQMVPALDVRAIYAQAEAATWASRAASTRPAAPADGGTQKPLRAAAPLPFEDDDGRVAWLPDVPPAQPPATGGTR
ncbi:Hypothetical protein A7982_09797 [Minicystis rosea]|nr:Hypothetical protein A7982_09797 [Minicystis rosea]